MVRGRGGRGRTPGTPNRKILQKLASKNSGYDRSGSPIPSNGSSPVGFRKSHRKSNKKAVVHITLDEYKTNSRDGYDSDSCESAYSVESIDSTNSPGQHSRIRPLSPDPGPEIKKSLKLPPSSDDLLISAENLMSALQVYEVVRHFGRILRISPFSFENFCAALKSDDVPCIIGEIHIALIKALLSEDEANQIVFGSSEEKDYVNIHMFLIDSFTWPEIVRSFIISDGDFSDLLPIINDPAFPFVSIESKLKVLTRLCDYVLSLNIIREEIINEGLFISDDHCRSCGRMGDLLCCELCPAVYHLECLKPPLLKVPEDEWFCPVCKSQQVKGVTDVLSELDRQFIYRNEPLGVDRHHRKFWFMVRRVIV